MEFPIPYENRGPWWHVQAGGQLQGAKMACLDREKVVRGQLRFGVNLSGGDSTKRFFISAQYYLSVFKCTCGSQLGGYRRRGQPPQWAKVRSNVKPTWRVQMGKPTFYVANSASKKVERRLIIDLPEVESIASNLRFRRGDCRNSGVNHLQ